MLSKLAHDFMVIDKDRPEVCCLVGANIQLIHLAIVALPFSHF